MKWRTIRWLALVCTLLIACGKEERTAPEKPSVPGALPCGEVRSFEEACIFARAALEMVNADGEERTFNEKRYKPYYAGGKAEPGEEPLLYVFNFDGGGTALVAMDRRVAPLLAAFETYEYGFSVVRRTPRDVRSGFDLYLNAVLDLLEGLRAKPHDPVLPAGPGELVIRHKAEVLPLVEPRIPVLWGQHFPYNGLCPMVSGERALSGFAAAAVGQIMTAYTFPKTMELTYPGADASSIALNWPGILQHENVSTEDWDCPEHKAIAQMCREIGQQLNMKYAKESSTADFSRMPACLFHFGFAADPMADYSAGMIQKSFREGGMACMEATTVDVLTPYRFVWVADGIVQTDVETQIWVIPENGEPARRLESRTQRQEFVHCNWGWDGVWNGYFSIDVFDPANPARLDEGNEKLRLSQFTQSLKIVTGIKPQQ